jgi:hypothetical protein
MRVTITISKYLCMVEHNDATTFVTDEKAIDRLAAVAADAVNFASNQYTEKATMADMWPNENHG